MKHKKLCIDRVTEKIEPEDVLNGEAALALLTPKKLQRIAVDAIKLRRILVGIRVMNRSGNSEEAKAFYINALSYLGKELSKEIYELLTQRSRRR